VFRHHSKTVTFSMLVPFLAHLEVQLPRKTTIADIYSFTIKASKCETHGKEIVDHLGLTGICKTHDVGTP